MRSCLSCIVDVPVNSKIRTDRVWNVHITCMQILKWTFTYFRSPNLRLGRLAIFERKTSLRPRFGPFVPCRLLSLLPWNIPLWNPSAEPSPHFSVFLPPVSARPSPLWASLRLPCQVSASTAPQTYDLTAAPAAAFNFPRSRTVRLANPPAGAVSRKNVVKFNQLR